MNVLQSVQAARRCGTPLIVIRTADPAATMAGIGAALGGKDAPPVIQWDIVRGALGANEEGRDALAETLAAAEMEQAGTTNPTEFVSFTVKLPGRSIVFLQNLHRFLDDAGLMQAMYNCRDQFKSAEKTIIGLCPSITLPAELAQDVLVLDEPLPTDADLKKIALDIYVSAELPAPDEAEQERIVDATLGLAAFPAEQSMAMSITRKGMDLEQLWERKRALVSQTDGLSVNASRSTFDDIGGCRNVKTYMNRIMAGAEPPRCFVFIDEGEKAFAGSSVAGGDSSGVSQNFLGTLLTDMQENKYTGTIFVGFPGSAKSMVAQSAGTTAGVPTITFDLSAMKSSLVGSSEANLRNALKVVKAVSQGRAFFIMTCNGISTLPPELKRRFRAGIFMFDLPDAEERNVIWRIYLDKYKDRLKGLDCTRPNDEYWTGSEIAVCVDNAYRMKCSLRDAATYIVPSYLSMGVERANRLRDEASGSYISASYAGPYKHNRSIAAPVVDPQKRVISFEPTSKGMN